MQKTTIYYSNETAAFEFFPTEIQVLPFKTNVILFSVLSDNSIKLTEISNEHAVLQQITVLTLSKHQSSR